MKEKIKSPEGNVVSYVTQITLENGKVYTLYSDGNLYEEVEANVFVPLNNLNEENKKIIEKIMTIFKPAKTDVIISKAERAIIRKIEIDEL